ncbi:MAG: diguanylate cyclase [Candidatus Brocadia sp.]|uniref:diguanylate cyclase n=1 Tax=Candidatus Brocadia fulgida TaxID=380242 RepID=A0A0M2USZ3_9BACT|nr:MAG: two-component response regulator [Candidatus Brocadia fulgida]MBV6517842.1 Regulator of RpoS [Candidatus Brocadia fulgida]MCC6325531.1 diguanylate cyclase [Candidatus Brocadia sp.]MDG5997572.1 diguanylate cyclase [Candidatus Brocadia sp.]
MKVLIAEDDNISRCRLEKFLEDMKYEVISCKDGLDAWEVIQSENAPNLLILDWMMPEMSGLEICRRVRQQAREPYTYILLLTSKNEDEDIVTGMEAGADDYITKPFNQNELRVRLSAGRRIVEMNKELLDTRDALRKKVIYDDLTGLHNRYYMSEILENEYSRALRHQTDLSCLLLDIDYFKIINDTFGHAFGDLVLREFSASLKLGARKYDFVFRYGGEEFLVLLPNTSIEGAQSVAEKIRAICESKTYTDGTNSTITTVSVGVASLKHHQPSESKELIAFADKALYRSKAEGRNRVSVYLKDSSMQSADDKVSESKDFRYLKETISSVLEKIRNASVQSLSYMVRTLVASEHRKHNQQVIQYIELVGERFNLPPRVIEAFKNAALIHDNFKVLLDKTLKSKNKGLNTSEKLEIESYPDMMAELTGLFDFFANERSILQHHHENFDGSGYPAGLKGNEIPLGARIFAIVDAMVAMLSERPFRKSLPPEKVIEEFADSAGSQFDPKLVFILFDIIEKQQVFSLPETVFMKAKEKVRKSMVNS